MKEREKEKRTSNVCMNKCRKCVEYNSGDQDALTHTTISARVLGLNAKKFSAR
jgi:hypothetical protein